MKIFKKITAVLIAAVMVLTLFPVSVIPIRAQAAEDGSLKLWYDEPASQGTNILSAGMNYSDADGSNLWQQQTLPIGNGDMGANVYSESGHLKEWYEETTIDSMNSQGADAAGHRHRQLWRRGRLHRHRGRQDRIRHRRRRDLHPVHPRAPRRSRQPGCRPRRSEHRKPDLERRCRRFLQCLPCLRQRCPHSHRFRAGRDLLHRHRSGYRGSLRHLLCDRRHERHRVHLQQWCTLNAPAGKGMDDTHFGPDGACTRAQVVTFLHAAQK